MVPWFPTCQNDVGAVEEIRNLKLVSQLGRWAHLKGATSQSL